MKTNGQGACRSTPKKKQKTGPAQNPKKRSREVEQKGWLPGGGAPKPNEQRTHYVRAGWRQGGRGIKKATWIEHDQVGDRQGVGGSGKDGES